MTELISMHRFCLVSNLLHDLCVLLRSLQKDLESQHTHTLSAPPPDDQWLEIHLGLVHDVGLAMIWCTSVKVRVHQLALSPCPG